MMSATGNPNTSASGADSAYGAAYGAYGAYYAPPPTNAGAAAGMPPAAAAPLPAAPAGDPRAQLVSYVEEFNGILKRLTCDLVVRYPTDAKIARAKRQIMLAIDMDPIFIIDAVGPYLYTYREQVYAGDDKFFIENDYDAELKESVDAEKADITSYIIPKVKEAWAAVGAEEKEAYKVTVQTLLDAYVEYLALKLAQ